MLGNQEFQKYAREQSEIAPVVSAEFSCSIKKSRHELENNKKILDEEDADEEILVMVHGKKSWNLKKADSKTVEQSY